MTRWLASIWLALVPIAALIAAPNSRPPKPSPYGWPSGSELRRVADQLVQRGLTHGFSNVIYANLMNMESGGRAITCPVYFYTFHLIPQRWLADTRCYTLSALPEKFYVITDHDDRDVLALRQTLPPPIEKFHVGKMYEVSVFRTADMDARWLDLPIHDGPELQLPLELPAVHPAFYRVTGRVHGDELVASGDENTILYGPFIRVMPGTYEVVWSGSGIDSPGELKFQVDTDMGQTLVARQMIQASQIRRDRGELARVEFTLDRPSDSIEFPVFSAGGAKVSLHNVVMRRR